MSVLLGHLCAKENKNMAIDTLRALRRHHIERLKAKWKRSKWKNTALSTIPSLASEEKQSGMFVTTRALCSCWMCGNPRKYWGQRSVQERRLMQSDSKRLVEFADDAL